MKKKPPTRKRFHLTFPPKRIQDPIIHTVGIQFNIVTNIRRANVTTDSGWVDLEIQGAEADIHKAVAFLEKKGIRVDPIEKSILE